jgi:hypothetical protein
MSSALSKRQGTEIILSGNEETLKPIITMCMALAQFFNDRDIGQFVGSPLEDNARAHPHSLRMKLIWYSKKSPPYTNSMGIRMIKAEYQIPDVNHSSIDWNILKQAMGGSDGYMWGRFVATVKLDNGRQMQCSNRARSRPADTSNDSPDNCQSFKFGNN